MDEMVRTFRELIGCPLWQAVRMASLTPAEIMGKADRVGSLAKGKFADVILIDDAINVTATYLARGGTVTAVPKFAFTSSPEACYAG